MELLISIVERGRAKHLVKRMKTHEVHAVFTALAEGTAKQKILQSLGLDEIPKEIVYILAEGASAEAIREEMRHDEELHLPGQVFYTIPLAEKEATMKAVAIHVIVDRGMADAVVEIAEKAGSRGATIIHGRGSGIERKQGFFNLLIEPEKDMVLMVCAPEAKQAIVRALRSELDFESSAGGVLYVLPVTEAIGFSFLQAPSDGSDSAEGAEGDSQGERWEHASPEDSPKRREETLDVWQEP